MQKHALKHSQASSRNSKDINLRTTFNNEAELYHAVRPRYPEDLFDALVRTAQLRDGAKLLEIGPGTGQATEPLTKRGYEITAVELGTGLAEVARKALEKYKNVEIITGAFEEVELPPESFDLVYAATAFHWVKPEVKFSKSHKLLKAGGHLVIIGTHHVSDEAGDEFFFEEKFGGSILKHFAMTLAIAKKKAKGWNKITFSLCAISVPIDSAAISLSRIDS